MIGGDQSFDYGSFRVLEGPGRGRFLSTGSMIYRQSELFLQIVSDEPMGYNFPLATSPELCASYDC